MKLSIFKAAVLAMCLTLYSAGANSNNQSGTNIKFNSLNSMQICRTANTDCIWEQTVIYDLFPNKRTTVIANYGMIGNKTFITVVNSIKYSEGQNSYAIFLVESRDIDAQGLPDCHGCSPKLGIAIYQYSNKWKLFSVNNNVAQFGSFGRTQISEKDFRIIPITTERFLITLRSRSMGQGYQTTTTSVFEVNPDYIMYKLGSNNTVNIAYLGDFESGSSDCGAKVDGEEWEGDPFINTKTYPPTIKMLKSLKKCGSKRTAKRESINLVYDKTKKSFINSTN